MKGRLEPGIDRRGRRIGDRQIGAADRTPGGRVGDRQLGAVDRTPGNRVGERRIGTGDRTPRVGDGPIGRDSRTPRNMNRATIPGLAKSGELGSRLSGDMQSQLSARRTQIQQNRADGIYRDRAQNRFENRDEMVTSRRDSLQNRMQDRRNLIDDRQEFRDGSREDRQDYRDRAREDWQDWAGHDHWDDHWDHDHWHGHWEDHWDHMWDEHPVYAAFRVTAWGVNRANYLFGWGAYYNPYPVATYPVNGYTIDYSEPLVADAPMEQYVTINNYSGSPQGGATEVATVQQEATPGVDGGAESPAPSVPSEAVINFDSARAAFRDGDYAKALESVDQAISLLPKDAALHEFRSLALFALGRYRESTAAIHAVLAVGPGWNWTTMSGLYENKDDYVKQLRALENHIRNQPRTADARFLLAYHYMTLGHNDSAKRQYQAVLELEPKDTVAADLLRMMGGEVPSSLSPSSGSGAIAGPKATEASLIGKWQAKDNDGAEYALSLDKSGEFTWAFKQAGKTQQIRGVFIVDDGVLAMEPDSGGVMLAQVSQPQDGSFTFQQAGDASKVIVFRKG